MQRVLDFFDDHLSDLVQNAIARVRASDLTFYRSAPDGALDASFTRAMRALREDLAHGTTTAFSSYVVAIGMSRADQGVSVGELLGALDLGFAAVSEQLERVFGADVEPRFWWERERFRISRIAVGDLWDRSLAARNEIIRAQTAEIYRLGATIVPLYRGILLLPLVGTVDAQRAEQLMLTLLDAIVARQSAVVIVDITGVPAVDTGVVGHLIRTSQATRLLGAEPVLVGINARIAQTMVELGVDLGAMTVRGTLEDGMSYALSRLGKVIADLKPFAASKAT